jgi:hypothetical protein
LALPATVNSNRINQHPQLGIAAANCAICGAQSSGNFFGKTMSPHLQRLIRFCLDL